MPWHMLQVLFTCMWATCKDFSFVEFLPVSDTLSNHAKGKPQKVA